MLPERIRQLQIEIAGPVRGQLLHHSVYEFRYLDTDPAQPSLGLLMPPQTPTWQAGDLFPVLDQNLPEGDLFMRLRQLHPKQPLTAMHLLALAGRNGIGRLGFRLADQPTPPDPPPMSRQALLATRFTPQVFDDLVRAYLSTGAGIAGMQPKIMVPDRATVPIPNLIVKTGSESYPGLAANEFLCLSAARQAGVLTPDFDLSDDGQMLLIDRFDIDDQGRRLGFEDIASLMGLRVRDVLSDRKYQGSYARIADVLKMLRLMAADLARFFEQVAFTVMVRNGDGHLKNFGVLYSDATDIRLAPMFDVVTTAIYRYTRYAGGPELEDQTLALKLRSGRHQGRGYPTVDELLRFGREVCGVRQPAQVLQRLAQGMAQALAAAQRDERIPRNTLQAMAGQWQRGMGYAQG
jgi:serine/threonine-protein kinase HipA